MQDFLGADLQVGDLVSVVVFAPAGEQAIWRLALGQIKQIPNPDNIGDLCNVYLVSEANPGWVEGRTNRVQLYSTAYRDVELTLLLDMFRHGRVHA